MTQKSSYGQILKSSSIMGGSAGINMLLGMVRTKFAAVFIDTAGVGLLTNFTAIQAVISTIAGLGIQSSAVREVAVAVGKGDEQAIGRVVLNLRRVSWFTGSMGMLAMILLSPMLSNLTFGTDQYALDIAALGIVILFGNLSGAQSALLQGMRRIGDLARANLYGAVFATFAATGFYAWLGIRGIVPALVSIGAMQLMLSWYFAKRISLQKISISWRETFTEANNMVQLGLVFMATGLMTNAVSYITVLLITKNINLEAVGLYSAAFALSGLFVNFVLGAMGSDYYPRLTAVANDPIAVSKLVNEQTEIGLLLALPGLMATMVLAPWILQTFYTQQFLGAVELLHWFVFGCLGRVISWPLGYLLLALGKGRCSLLVEASFNIFHAFLIALGLQLFGIQGVAIAFFFMCMGYIIAVYCVNRYLVSFKWSKECFKLGVNAFIGLTLSFFVCRFLPQETGILLGVAITFVSGLFCLRGLASRVGVDNRIFQIIGKIPGAKFLFL